MSNELKFLSKQRHDEETGLLADVLAMKVTGAIFALVISFWPSPSPAQISLSVRPVNEASVVYDWSTQRCETQDVPDAPIRAVRLADGSILAIDSAVDTRLFLGPDLDHLRHDCTVVYKSEHNPDPSKYADRTWIASLWTDDGKTIYGLDHNEYHADLHPGRCQFHTLEQCWYAAIGLIKSIDAGKSFQRVAVEPIAAAPVREEVSQGQRRGFANPTNILLKDGYYYTIIRANLFGSQRQGNCLFRAKRIDDIHSWTLFDGKTFIPSQTDPYENPAGNQTPCAVLSLGGALGSVVQYEKTGLYVAISEMRDPDGQNGQILISTSADLLGWSAPKIVAKLPTAIAHQCNDSYTYAYPTLMDPTSPSRNFATIGAHPFLYMTRIRMSKCGLTPNRDLVRLGVQFDQ